MPALKLLIAALAITVATEEPMPDDNSAFPTDPHLTAIAIAYKNPDKVLIADDVLPRVPVGSTLFEYTAFNDAAKGYTVPNTMVGPRGRVNRVDLSGQRLPGTTEDQGLDIPLSHFDVNATGEKVDARGRATELATSLIQLGREVRVASLVFNAATYPTGRKEALVGADQLDHDDYEGNPIRLISDGLDAALIRPNVLVFGQRSWSVFRGLPQIVKAVQGNSGDSGLARRQQVAELFEVSEVLVGEGFVNINKPGEAPEFHRVWGGHIAAIYRDRAAASAGGLTFGATFEYGSRVAKSIKDEDVGLRGGERVRVGESVRELVVAPDAAYFWEDVVAA
jgi:hypothetical protein